MDKIDSERMRLCLGENKNKDDLKDFGRKFGFKDQYGRKIGWCAIKDTLNSTERKDHSQNFDGPHEHKYLEQVELDVKRALMSLDYYNDITEEDVNRHKKSLSDLLQRFFTNHKDVSYYQGYHDVATVFLYVLGKDDAYDMMVKTTDLYFKDWMTLEYDVCVFPLLNGTMNIIKYFDPEFGDILSTNLGMPMFILSWLFSWFSHMAKEMKIVARIYDYMLCSPNYSIIYICAALILITKQELYNSVSEIELGEIQLFYRDVKINDVELLLSATMILEDKFPYEMLCESITLPKESIYHISNKQNVVKQKYKHCNPTACEIILKNIKNDPKILSFTQQCRRAFAVNILFTGAVIFISKQIARST